MGSSKYTSTSFRPFTEGQKAEVPVQDVREFVVPDLSKEGRPTYSQIKETFAKDVKKKDQRFFLSELVAGQLSVEEEETRRFDIRIAQELEVRTAAIRTQAYEDGYNKGLEKGVEKAFDEEKARIAARMESLASATNDLIDSKAKLEADYEKQLTEYAFRIAEVIVESEIDNRPESVSQVVKNALELLSKEEDVKIYLGLANKDHIGYVQEEISKINRKGSFSIEVKNNLKPGDCVVETMSGEVSAKVSERIAALKQEVMARFVHKDEKKAV